MTMVGAITQGFRIPVCLLAARYYPSGPDTKRGVSPPPHTPKRASQIGRRVCEVSRPLVEWAPRNAQKTEKPPILTLNRKWQLFKLFSFYSVKKFGAYLLLHQGCQSQIHRRPKTKFARNRGPD